MRLIKIIKINKIMMLITVNKTALTVGLSVSSVNTGLECLSSSEMYPCSLSFSLSCELPLLYFDECLLDFFRELAGCTG